MHQGIFNIDPKATSVGIVAVELSACAVMLWPGLAGATGPFNFKTYWWTATSITGMGANKLVLSVVVHDVSYGHADPSDPSGSQPWPWTFSTAVAVYSDSNALVANVQVAAARGAPINVSPTFAFSNGTQRKITVPYPVDNRYGIDVNQVLIGGVAGHAAGTSCPSGQGTLVPTCFPAEYRTGITIRDSYVYQNGRVGIAWSGGAAKVGTMGAGPQIVNNHVEVAANTICWSVDGRHFTVGSDTNENRGYNMQGWSNNVCVGS